MSDWTLDAGDGKLTLHTGVAGRAARMGHRLTIAMTRWRVRVNWVGGEPGTAELVVEVASFEPLRGAGGIKALSGPEKAIVRLNALKSLSANRYPEIRFLAHAIDPTEDGYRLTGTLHIRGKSRAHVVDLRTDQHDDSWLLSVESSVSQSAYGIKPYSMFMGALQVTDEVRVSFAATSHT